MTRALIVNNRGEVEVDPFNTKGTFDSWLESIKTPGGTNYAALTQNKAAHSEAIVRYVLTLLLGKTRRKGTEKAHEAPHTSSRPGIICRCCSAS